MATPISILHSKALKSLINECYRGDKEVVDETFQRFLTQRSHLFSLMDAELGSLSEFAISDTGFCGV
jgi:hypothetical protein